MSEVDYHVTAGNISQRLGESMKAAIAAGFDPEEATRRLEALHGGGSCDDVLWLAGFAKEPRFDRLRELPAFRALLTRVGMPGW